MQEIKQIIEILELNTQIISQIPSVYQRTQEALRTAQQARTKAEELEVALDESLKLQSHYAKLLNMHDGGKRIGFKTTEEWINRLKEIKKIAA